MSRYEELERKLDALPVAEQAQWIRRFLEELQAQAGDNDAATVTAGGWIAGRKPSRAKAAVAVEQLRRFRQGKLLGEDLSLRDLIMGSGRRNGAVV